MIRFLTLRNACGMIWPNDSSASPHVTTQQISFLVLSEIIELLVIARIWLKRRHRRLVVRLLWSVVLLVPVFGVVAYFFLREDPKPHPYHTDTMRGAAESFAEGSGH
jgi:hypothetical protein